MLTSVIVLSILNLTAGYIVYTNPYSGHPAVAAPYAYRTFSSRLVQPNYGLSFNQRIYPINQGFYQNLYLPRTFLSANQPTNRDTVQISSLAKQITDPCSPSPCGANASCSASKGAAKAVCSCPDGWQGDAYAATGCQPEQPSCNTTADCSQGLTCMDSVCVRACAVGSCGVDADCRMLGHLRRQCFCPAGYTGNPLVQCSALTQVKSVTFDAPEKIQPEPQPGIVQESLAAKSSTFDFMNSKISPVLLSLRAKTRGVQPSGVLVV